MRLPISRTLLLAAALATLTACGSTSSMRKSEYAEATRPTASGQVAGEAVSGALDFRRFERVLVRDFQNSTRITTRNPAKREVQEGQAVSAGKRFADRIAENLSAAQGFAEVLREGEAGPGTLIIEGKVTKYKEGNAALRMMIGFGAGSSNFDARVSFVDGGTGRELSHIMVDKNSWFLGGGIAMTQTADGFINGAAQKVAEQTIAARGAAE